MFPLAWACDLIHPINLCEPNQLHFSDFPNLEAKRRAQGGKSPKRMAWFWSCNSLRCSHQTTENRSYKIENKYPFCVYPHLISFWIFVGPYVWLLAGEVYIQDMQNMNGTWSCQLCLYLSPCNMSEGLYLLGRRLFHITKLFNQTWFTAPPGMYRTL